MKNKKAIDIKLSPKREVVQEQKLSNFNQFLKHLLDYDPTAHKSKAVKATR